MRRAEFERTRAAHIERLKTGWEPDDEAGEALSVMARLTCTDDECRNGTTDAPLRVQVHGRYKALCGHCMGPLHAVLLHDDEEQDIGHIHPQEERCRP